MSERIMENLTIRPLNDVSEKLSKRANEHEIRNGALSALTERCNRLEVENAKLRELCGDLFDRLMDKDEHCGECRSQCEHDAWNFGDPKCVYAKRVRELRIEADE